MEWLSDIKNWLYDLFASILSYLGTVLKDAFLDVLQLVLDGISALIALIPAPSFLQGNTINTLLGQMPSNALYVIGQLNISAAFGILAAGFAFRMARKLFTLGQW